MSTPRLAAVILAAGQGKRMKSDLPKVMHEVGGKPMVELVFRLSQKLGADPIVVIVGYGRESVIRKLDELGADHAVQEQQLGTGHAVLCAEEALKGFTGDVLVLAGDVPMLTEKTLVSATELHRSENAAVTIITAEAPDPTGYGRILRDDSGNIVGIREHRDANEKELLVREINSGILLFNKEFLFDALKKTGNNNAQGEYYLTDVVFEAFNSGRKVAGYIAPFVETTGVNSAEDLQTVRALWEERSDLT